VAYGVTWFKLLHISWGDMSSMCCCVWVLEGIKAGGGPSPLVLFRVVFSQCIPVLAFLVSA
jgi:hypothetical protein